MPLTSLWQFLIPDSLLLEIFTYLDIRDLGHVAPVCRLWQRISQDELLWQGIARTRWKIKGQICPGADSWRSEVKRLIHHAPCVKSQVFTDAHIDEVLDVCISHRGDMFCTTSKDSLVILWKLDFPATEITRVDTKKTFNWSLTQYSKFNNDDSLLLVCGVLIPENYHHYNDVSLGRGAIFTVPELIPLQLVSLDPPTLFGAWLTGDIFIGGNLKGLHTAIRIEAHKVPGSIPMDCDWKNQNVSDNPVELFYFRGNKHHQMSVLVADVACDEPQDTKDVKDIQSGTTSCDLDSHCSTCVSGRSMTDSQPGNIYQLLSLVNHDEQCEYETPKKQQNLSRGSGDSESDYLGHKRMRLYSNSRKFEIEREEKKTVNQNILDLENNASFWDDLGCGNTSGHQIKWCSNNVAKAFVELDHFSGTRKESLCQSGCQGSGAKVKGNDSGLNPVSDINGETLLCSVCKTANIANSQSRGDCKNGARRSGDVPVSSAYVRPSCSDMSVSSAGLLPVSHSSSITMTGLSLRSNSDFNLRSSACSVQTEESYSGRGSQSNNANCLEDSEQDSSANSTRNISYDEYYNTESDADCSSSLLSDVCTSPPFLISDKLYCNRSAQTVVSWMDLFKTGNFIFQPSLSTCTLVAKETTSVSSEGMKSPMYFCNSSRSCSNREGNFRKYVCFVSGAHDAIVVQEVTVDKLRSVEDILSKEIKMRTVIARDAMDYDTKDHYFFIKNCYITGMCLSHDHRYIYFNYREWARQQGEESDSDPEPEDPLRDVSEKNFHENIKVGAIDLVKMCKVEGLSYEGHIGYSSYPAWYICLAASENYIGSGSENARAYLWDKHYQVKLAELKHTQLVVNGLAFSPVDQEVCISVCDDKSIIIWRSRNRMSELVDASKQQLC